MDRLEFEQEVVTNLKQMNAKLDMLGIMDMKLEPKENAVLRVWNNMTPGNRKLIIIIGGVLLAFQFNLIDEETLRGIINVATGGFVG